MTSTDIAYLTIGKAAAAIRSGAVSPVELTQAALERIADLDDRVQAYSMVDGEAALDAARAAERRPDAGIGRGPLHGIALAIKDIVDVAGLPTTAGSRVLAGNVAHEDAALVAALRAAGAIVLGKTNTHEFAYGVVTPPTRNPWDLDRIPGGSSGGSAAALAARMAYGAVGTDTAGSIRLPAALCGVVGLKPTYGRVSRHGVIPLSWSLDHAGPMTRSVLDAALLFHVMSSGYDPRDPATSDVPPPNIVLDGGDLRGLRAGIPRTYFYERLEPDVATAVEGALEVLAGLGMELREVKLPHTERTFGIGRAIQRPEASAYHGQRLRATPELYGEELRRDLELGELFLATDYIHAQRLRAEMRAGWQHVLNGLDVLVTPTVPAVAPLVKDSATSGGIKGVLLRNTYPVNLVGFPALSLPCGRGAGGLPVGLQIIGRPFDEATVLQVGHAYEQATAWHEARPAL